MADENSLALKVWVKHGIMLVRRECLDVTDPESYPMKWHEKFGSVDGFPWQEMYGRYSDEARKAFFLKTKPKSNKYCPCCGETME